MATLNIMVGEAEGKVPVKVMRLEGDIDASTQKMFQDKASEVIGAGAENILVDLSGVNYMGSAGFRVLHAMANELGGGDGSLHKSPHLKLLNPTEAVARVIKTLGFDVYLDIHTDREEAIQAF